MNMSPYNHHLDIQDITHPLEVPSLVLPSSC
jgi:hypothetical protein